MSGYDYYDDGHYEMPDPADAAQNLEDFVSWFGDGNVYGDPEDEDDLPVCHSRDICALIVAYRTLAQK